MGRGSSGLGKKSGGGGAPAKANTPSGVDYQQFMAMSEQQRWQTMSNIISDKSIQVPAYLDASDTSKVIYALGMDNKPAVVSDAQLDVMPGRDLYRTVYENGSMPPPSSAGILDQIRNGDYTQLSGSGGSAHGRALYFADSFVASANYGDYGNNAKMMRVKVNSNAVMVKEATLQNQINAKGITAATFGTNANADIKGLYALSQGIDGWTSNWGYTMIVNRRALSASNQNKSTRIALKSGKPGKRRAQSWQSAANVD